MVEKVVITGMGAVSPLGIGVEQTWDNLIKGVSGVGPITLFDAAEMDVRIACEVKDFDPAAHMSAREARRRDRFEQFAAVAANEAIQQAGLVLVELDPERVGVIISSAIGGIETTQDSIITMLDKGARRVSPFAIPMLMSNGAAGLVSIDHGYQGPSFSVASACASGADGIGMAWMMVRAGMIDVAISGASEATITEIGIACFDRVGAMSRRNDNYSMTPQPFSLERDGLVMGEGAAVLVLESEAHARRRGAHILAELAGYGATADAFHVTAPTEDGDGGARAMRQALQTAGVEDLSEVGYINAHGTGTALNDTAETSAIKSVFGELAYGIPVSSTKSMTGHMMGATGALEALFCAQAIRHSTLPPTIHYQTPDPACDLDYVPNQARAADVRVALSNSFGFGGHNAVLVLREWGE